MMIDEAAFDVAIRATGFYDHIGAARMMREFIGAYLSAALPSAEPGRDRIAAIVNRHGLGHAWVIDPQSEREMDERDWRDIEDECSDIKSGIGDDTFAGPYARVLIRCNLPRPAEPVEVEGSVERVGP